METEVLRRRITLCRFYSGMSGFAAILIGASVILCWRLRLDVFEGIFPGWVAMNPATAVAFILAGAALATLNASMDDTRRNGRRRAVQACALIILMIAGLALAGILFGWDKGVDRWLFASALESASSGIPNRMAPNTAVIFLLLGGALLLLNTGDARRVVTAQLLTTAAAWMALLALLGYAYRAEHLYTIAGFIPMAMNTSAAFLILSTGLLCTRADSGLMLVLTSASPSGRTARRLLPASIIIPAVLGWLQIKGRTTGIYGIGFGEAEHTALLILLFAGGIYWNMRLAHRIELERDEAEKLFHKIVEFSPTAKIVIDQKGNIVLINAQAEKLFLYSRQELIGRPIEMLMPARFQKHHPGQVAGFVAHPQARAMGAGRDLFGLRKDGMEIPIEIGLNPIETSQGPLVLATIIDLTDRKALERVLEEKVHERTADLGKATDELRREVGEKAKLQAQLVQSQKMEAVGRLAGGVAHDFNNILTAIGGYSHFLRDSLAPNDKRRDDVDQIMKAGERAAALTHQLLAFSRQQRLEQKVLDCNALVANLEKMLRRIIGEDVELAAVLAPGTGRIKADQGQIEQVLMNLVVNAKDAMPKGGRITIETANVELTDDYSRMLLQVKPGSYVMFSVSDTGSGMDANILSHLFEPFFTTKEQGKGTGLGLATVYGVVKQSGGGIQVQSAPGQGTTFKAYFPRVEEAAQASEASPGSAHPPAGSETILLVEDDEQVRRFIQRALNAGGYTILAAQDPGQALRLAEQHKNAVQLILTDVVMPQMHGPELVKRLSALCPKSKVIYMSGYTDTTAAHRDLAGGDAHFLQKPLAPGVLARKVREVLDLPQ